MRQQHEKAAGILLENREKLDELARYLYQKETITGEEFMKILNEDGLLQLKFRNAFKSKEGGLFQNRNNPPSF